MMTNSMSSNKMTRGQQLTNVLITVLIAGLLWTFLLMINSGYLVPMVAKGRLPFYILHVYNGVMFAMIGVIVGVLSKVKVHIVILITFLAMFAILALFKSGSENILSLFNLSTILGLSSMAIGGLIGKKLRRT